MITDNDDRTGYCPMLGHELHFSYCRSPGAPQPCRKIFDCWWQQFDIAAFMEQHYPQSTVEAAQQPPKAKMLSLLELIEQAKKNTGK